MSTDGEQKFPIDESNQMDPYPPRRPSVDYWLIPTVDAARTKRLKCLPSFNISSSGGVSWTASLPHDRCSRALRSFTYNAKQIPLWRARRDGTCLIATTSNHRQTNSFDVSELGDYDPRRHSSGYVSEFRLLAHQTPELEARAAEIHRTLTGISPAQAELSYLDKVKWLDMYGVDLHPVLYKKHLKIQNWGGEVWGVDINVLNPASIVFNASTLVVARMTFSLFGRSNGEDSVEYFLGLAPSGLLLLRGKHTVANYYWPRVSKLYYKGRYFMLRVADKNNNNIESVNIDVMKLMRKAPSVNNSIFSIQTVERNSFKTLLARRVNVQNNHWFQMRLRHTGSSHRQGPRAATSGDVVPTTMLSSGYNKRLLLPPISSLWDRD
ncbi:unnamed protein product [Diatraea saccharalis]|uniref:FERM C-terminal PH-like domain-containing protein n=1 Tax=Diatraea saccharalis TaxID=40085 RepID=A0A9N9WIJ0_9NEOP|nr:unnamed protein product [Diatraea saccharalis]